MQPRAGEGRAEIIEMLGDKVRRLGSRRLGEQDTKASLIEPLLEALGWNVRDPAEVRREFRATPSDSPVDYALAIHAKHVMLIEAKALGANLADRRLISQCLGYSVMAGVAWCVLTDGDRYCMYNATAEVPAERKLFWSARVSGDADEQRSLGFLSRRIFRGGGPAPAWRALCGERRVSEALSALAIKSSGGLVDQVLDQCKDLSRSEASAAIRSIVGRIEPRCPMPDQESLDQKESAGAAAASSSALASMRSAGLLLPPVDLHATYRGRRLTATLLPDLRIRVERRHFASPSGAARGAVHLRGARARKAVNGWSFWSVRTDAGERTLADLRRLCRSIHEER